jgi:diguanylate cyclase (GGDEF)-like protein
MLPTDRFRARFASFFSFLALLAMAAIAGPAEASQPLPWQLGMQPAVTPAKEFIGSFHNMLLVIITLITSLMVLVVNANRTRTNRQLQQLAGSLERTVVERTEQLEAANAQLQRLSDTDGLTGITNRRRFDALLRERWRTATRAGSSLAVAMIDIDHFKAYNDHYGHQAGDRCLQQVAAALAAEIRRGSDCVARYGGEEFVVLWCGLTLDQASAMAERLLQRVTALALPHASNPSGPIVSLSIGVAARQLQGQATAPLIEELEPQITALLQQADARLYAAKTAGRNRVVSG